ncbi:unnamed protein product [Lepeophtheirus salmonis]|uniref:(salmon louse) hypothetical protein n=1 Tax=Lepeophtheirus salmonis TaxID=72036 RepID=A0A7R8HDC9_LEPSM|nr:unnamed protein product [Lepeophtheirus salmonis]CAF3021000.1 unnamed protein product [Lepeophtheirus salmonis]
MYHQVVNQYNGEFPAISICPWDPYYKVDVLKEDYNLTSVGHFNKMTEKQENLIWHNKYGQDIIGNITFHLDDLLSDLKIRALRTLNDTLSQTIHPKIQNLKYKEKLHRKFGKCYSLNLSNETGDRGIYYVKMKLKKNIKLYIHADDQFLDLSGRMGYEIRLGETTKAQVNYQVINTIPGGTNRFNCSYNSFDDCMYNSMKERMLSEYGCIAPWIPHTDPRDKTCYTTKDKLGVYKIIYNRWNDCLDPCHYMIVNVGGKTVNPATKDTYVYLYFAHRVLVTKEHYLYDLLSLFAEIGGLNKFKKCTNFEKAELQRNVNGTLSRPFDPVLEVLADASFRGYGISLSDGRAFQSIWNGKHKVTSPRNYAIISEDDNEALRGTSSPGNGGNTTMKEWTLVPRNTRVSHIIQRTGEGEITSMGSGEIELTRVSLKGAGTQTPSRWLKELISRAGVNAESFKPHSSRVAIVRFRCNDGCSIQDIMQSGFWFRDLCFFRSFKMLVSYVINRKTLESEEDVIRCDV